ncbi:zinc metallopeptidase [Neokomagataea thailandica NBRC 106555]|uniref:Zinc metalloprotease n=2 Tax=Neokomagataea TaxID=1223423 RepID=A0A4Y6V7J3_9PROT|nr:MULTISPECIES: RIP metalloprotease RseP [Neokomagataea]QDH24828.1 RIP metalloprotease RseP [Neokomagataea tanensis]GBR50074.1 zinc metallopeptidase [Neokomagataea thailandica NBRC 106555]
MFDLLRTLLAYVLILGVLVFIHEFGHYFAARLCGVKVDTFSIGFGPALRRWYDRTGTEWRISAVPLGGYVKPHGFEGPEDATDEQKAAWVPGKTFHSKSVGARALVIVMGPVFNYIFAIIAFTVLFSTVGQPHLKESVASVSAGSAAEKAGLQAGDVIKKIGTLPMSGPQDVMGTVSARPDVTTTLDVLRDGHDLTLPVTFDSQPTSGKNQRKTGLLGISFAVEPGHPLPVWTAAVKGVQESWVTSERILQGVGQIITGQRSPRELGGTIRIAQMSGQVSHYGWASILSFMALLSINLGLINLFPIPVLDGGRLVFYAAEAVLRRPVPKKIQDMGMQVGIALIAALFLFSTVNDLTNLGLFRWLVHLAG